jgi:hypothetical protein
MLSITLRPTVRSYDVVYATKEAEWHVLDPLGGAICSTRSRRRAEEIALKLAELRAARYDRWDGC